MEKNNQDKRIKVGAIGEAVLATVAVAGIVTVAGLFPGVASIIAPFIKRKKYQSKQVIAKSVDSLIRAGLLKKTTTPKGDVQVRLTKKGEWEAFLRFNTQDTSCVKWDGMWRVVIFDVPQVKANIRKELRRAMRLFGFRMLQQSVWVYPYPCDDFIKIIKTHLGVSNDVLYIKANYIENDKHLRKEFSL